VNPIGGDPVVMTAHDDTGMRAYYAARAREYERIYQKPERQPDLRLLEREIPALLRGRRVLEIACGTGYWTQFIATSATRVLATDISIETLREAQVKQLDPALVEYRIADAYALDPDLGRFDAAFAGFWWSHLPLQRVPQFLASLAACLAPGAIVLMLDNRYVPGSSTPLGRTDAQGNTYQIRHLQDGTRHEVLKNFPCEAQMRAQLGAWADSVEFREFEHYWRCCWSLRAGLAS
jgi:SAM-dependent methyltransferase